MKLHKPFSALSSAPWPLNLDSEIGEILHAFRIAPTTNVHLQLVCKRTRSEILPILAKSTVRFHCSKCFDELLRNLSHGLGVGVTWMKHVEIVLDLTNQLSSWHRLTMELGKTSARETMSLARKTAWLWYGRLDLMGKERWTYEPMNEKDDVQGEMQPAGAQPQAHFTGANHPHHPHATAPQMHPLRIPEKWLISGWFDI